MYVCPECGSSSAGAGSCSTDGSTLVASKDPLLGQTVGSYRIARLIGAGGMGRVYKGVQPTIGSRVAIKILTPECAGNPALVERFFAEARAVNVIRHESIVNVLDLAALPDGQPYIVMEYLDGEPLSALIQRLGALPLGTVTRLITEVLGALAAAHQHGIIHRDLKPDNVFVTTGGRAKVLDFGIAKLKPGIAEIHDATRTGSLLGTPHYMSPEQAAGRQVDARSDLYSVGIILFEAATGKRAFDSAVLYDLLRQHIEQPPPSPRSLRAEIPPAYELCVLRALEKDPSRRFSSAQEFASALGQAARFLPEDSWAPLPVSRGPHGTSPMRSVAAATPGASAFQAAHALPRAQMKPTMGAPHGALPTSAPTPAAPYSPGPLPTPPQQPAAPYGVGYPGSVAGYANTMGGAAPRQRRSMLPYFVIGTIALLMLGAMGTCVAIVAIGSNADTEKRSAKSTPTDPGTPTTTATIADTPIPSFTGSIPGFHTEQLTNTKHFDLYAFLPKAEKMAHGFLKDAKLTRIDSNGVHPDGTVDLSYQSSFVLYRFRSPSASKRPPGTPDNVKYEGRCMAYVSVRDAQVQAFVPGSGDCEAPILDTPHCSPAQVWRHAARVGAPSGNVIGMLDFYPDDAGHARWLVSVPPGFTKFIDDACAR